MNDNNSSSRHSKENCRSTMDMNLHTDNSPIRSNDTDERTDILRTMKSLENTVYRRPQAQCLPDTFSGVWRKQIIEWMYILVKYCKLKHEATAAAVYYLDAAVWTSCSFTSTLVLTPLDYQLCAMTALHLALKVYDSPAVRVVKLSCLVKLGNGEFTEDDIIQKEQDLVRTLQWRINPPTVNCFLQRYLELVPFFDDYDVDDDSDSCDIHSKSEESDQLGSVERRRRERLMKIEEIAYEFMEVAVTHDRFLSVPSSVVAYAALLSAMEVTMELEQEQGRQQSFCSFDYDWDTFVDNMKNVAEMGDITNEDNCDADGRNLTRMVLQTKMLLERIVQGLPVPPEEEDGDLYNAVFSKTMIYCDKRKNRDDNNQGGKKNKNSAYGNFGTASSDISSPPRSPTSTI
mmetsp:Transcript_12494/g.35485  ORF Transcript_12494/g.35485 Transcript_12494/m.35485 type:complete len:402 (-) Transcript_12494:273-1478(-)